MGNEGFWAWALGKKNNDTRVIAKRWKTLGKTAIQHPCSAGDWLGKKMTPWCSLEPMPKRWETNGFCRARAMYTRE